MHFSSFQPFHGISLVHTWTNADPTFALGFGRKKQGTWHEWWFSSFRIGVSMPRLRCSRQSAIFTRCTYSPSVRPACRSIWVIKRCPLANDIQYLHRSSFPTDRSFYLPITKLFERLVQKNYYYLLYRAVWNREIDTCMLRYLVIPTST